MYSVLEVPALCRACCKHANDTWHVLQKGAAIREAAQASALSGPSAAGMEVTAVGGRRLKGWKLRGSA